MGPIWPGRHIDSTHLHGVLHTVRLQYEVGVLLVALSDGLQQGYHHSGAHSIRSVQEEEAVDVVIFNLVVVFSSVHAHEGGVHLSGQGQWRSD